ncbi:MAG: prephenate dehydrogenase/arogenate dehydrogenase family protein [Planctomycetota bacterium]|jgi:prephenate dehydrogenase|nr:prephenate dehydrogenase/arogenate dehydrogenase family protein [Planctomycetota bacterium]
MILQRVCIIGVGLLGGSIGLALHRKRLAKHVVGVGRTTSRLDAAIRRGAIDEATDDILVGAKDADLVIACVPIQSIVDSLDIASKVALPDAMLTDVGSTKHTIIKAACGRLSDRQFLGSHPIAGGHHSGVEHATGTLLDSALVVLTPTEATCPELVTRMSRFWEAMGSKITLLDAASHDQALAISSHLPHVVASALAFSTPHEILPFVGKGWLDSTRIAGSNPQLWRQILEENQAPALHALKKFATICETWIEALEGSDFDRIEELLQSGKTTRESVASRHSSG